MEAEELLGTAPRASLRQILDDTANTRAISGSRALHRTVLWLHERLRFRPLAFWKPQRLGEFRQCLRSGAGREAGKPR